MRLDFSNTPTEPVDGPRYFAPHPKPIREMTAEELQEDLERRADDYKRLFRVEKRPFVPETNFWAMTAIAAGVVILIAGGYIGWWK